MAKDSSLNQVQRDELTQRLTELVSDLQDAYLGMYGLLVYHNVITKDELCGLRIVETEIDDLRRRIDRYADDRDNTRTTCPCGQACKVNGNGCQPASGDAADNGDPPITAELQAKADAIRAKGGTPKPYRTKHGTWAVMDTSKIGKHHANGRLPTPESP